MKTIVYVLMDSSRNRPVAVLAEPRCDDLLPADAVPVPFTPGNDPRCRLVGAWRSELTGAAYALLEYQVL